MKKLALGIVFFIIMGFAAKEFISGSKAAAEPDASGYKFYYYPNLNVYYDATQNNFVYTVDGGMTWQTKKPASADLPDKLGKKVTFYSADPDAWINNTAHRRQYKGIATNYIQRPEDTATFVAPPPVPAKDSIVTAQKENTGKKESGKEKKKGSSWFNRFKDRLKEGFKKIKESDTDSL